jgi:hypothetical protein
VRRVLVAISASVGLGLSAGVAQADPPTLTGEVFHEDLPTLTAVDCNESTDFSYSTTGTATGPYPGTYTETGKLTFNRLEATFTIDSPVGKVKGTKSANAGVSCGEGPPCSSAAECDDEGASYNTLPGGFSDTDTYKATIAVPGGGAYSDSGLFKAVFYHSEDHNSPNDGFDSSFQSDLGTPDFIGPKTIEQCRHGGWWLLGFDYQGACVAYAKHRARQACTFERAAHGVEAFRVKYGIGPQHERAMWSCIHARVGF